MLGEKIGEESGKIVSRRVLPDPNGSPKLETSAQTNLTLLGVKATNTVTYWSRIRPDGTLYGEGQGIVMSREGDLATWVGQGVGTVKKDGSVSYRGTVYYQTSSERWMRLNSVAAIFEYEVDTEGNTSAQLWEWK
ncbi:MAG TPA: hypothetical protein VNQ79_02260 [Blastocatellia bacterium]|nr:hypothetical protein [Blastocatellia bacterium]